MESQTLFTKRAWSVSHSLSYLPAIIFGAATSMMLILRPNIERYLTEIAPGNHMPDAFRELNEVMPFFLLFGTTTAILAGRLVRRRQPSLFIPLLFGPLLCIAWWSATENFADPNWFHLFALSTIGMVVSTLVTFLLSIADW
jgi:hypothetical protein